MCCLAALAVAKNAAPIQTVTTDWKKRIVFRTFTNAPSKRIAAEVVSLSDAASDCQSYAREVHE